MGVRHQRTPPPRLQAYQRLLEGWSAKHHAPPSGTAPAAPEPAPPAAAQAPAPEASAPPPRRPGRATASPARTTVAPTAPTAPTAPAAAESRFPAGPLAAIDGTPAAHLADGRTLDCPAATLPELADWALRAGLGQERLHRHGRDGDPLLVLTPAAAERFGLPDRLTDRRGLRLPEDHPAVRELAAAGWQLTKRGFGPWARVYRPVTERGGARRCVQLAVLPWGALDPRSWPGTEELPAPELARTLGTYAARVLTPRGSTAVTGLELMTALRPPTRPVRAADDRSWTSGPLPGSLTAAVEPAPPEAPEEHPAARDRPGNGALDEEAYDWTRDPELLTDDECALPYAVGIDINMAFAAAANRLIVGLGEAIRTDGPRFDPKVPGCWLVDLSDVPTDPRLPSPFTPHGRRPEGPAWYATPTIAYAQELGAAVRPLEAWLRPESGPYLAPWYTRLRDAYLATMADAGVTGDLSEEQFLTAMAADRDPATQAVLSAVKATVKGGIGKLRERPQGAGYRPGRRWPALDRPTWRPDIRAAVIAQARTNLHRKMARMASAAGLLPVAVLSDCAVYPAAGPSPLDVIPRDPGTGKPAPGVFRIGVSPGMAKHEGTLPFWRCAELLEAGANPARHIKDDDGA